MTAHLDNVVAQWTRSGAMFGASPADRTPDLERLLLDTARRAPQMPRLFIMATTWLTRYGELVAKHRLKRLIRDELEAEHRPALGLLLDIAQQGTHPLRFGATIKHLEPAAEPGPLFQVERRYPSAARRAERLASALSRKWARWAAPFDLKFDALRPPEWVMDQNPSFLLRADFRGDLRSSLLAALQHDAGASESELALAQAAGGSRAQVRHALENLELTGRVRRLPRGRRTAIELADPLLAA